MPVQKNNAPNSDDTQQLIPNPAMNTSTKIICANSAKIVNSYQESFRRVSLRIVRVNLPNYES